MHLRLGEGQAHWFLDENVLAGPRGGDNAVGVVLVAVEDKDGVEIGPPHQGEGIVVAIGMLYPVPVSDSLQQPG